MSHIEVTPTVYVVNETLQRDGDGSLGRKIDLSPALTFGQLRYLLPAGAPPMDPSVLVADLRAGLADFRPIDYLVPVGSIIAIGAAVAIAAARTGGVVRLLRWHARFRRYERVELDLREPALTEP